MKRFSISNSSVRQSLGMPSRNFSTENGEGLDTKGKSKPPMVGGSKPSTASGNQRRKTVSKPSAPSTQFSRRQTQSGALGSSRTSTGRSSMYGQSHSQVKKDPRQLSEKSRQAATIRKLIAFLSEHNYPKTLTPKLLQLPTTKDFLAILNFLLEMIDETLIVDGMNLVESVPRVLKAVRYPFPVSKNHLLNVGSPHSWPILLGALDFLVDVCHIPDRTNELLFGSDLEDEECGSEQSMEFELVAVMYKTYMEYGSDSAEFLDLSEKRISGIRERKDRYEEAVVKSREAKRQLDEAIEELSKSSIMALQEQLRQMQAEHEQVRAVMDTELFPAIEQMEQAIVNAESANSQTEIQIEECKRKSEELEEQIRQQPMNSKELKEVRQRMKEDHELLDKYRHMVDGWNQQIGELQMKHNRTVSGIDSSCSTANDQLRRLAAKFPDIASLNPLDHDTSKRADPEVLQRLVTHARTLRHQVTGLMQRVASNCSELENKIINAEATQSALNSEKIRKQLEIDNLQHKLDIEKDALDQKRKLFEEAIKTEQAEKHALEKQLLTLQQKLQEESEAERVNQTVNKQLVAEQVAVERALADKHKEFMEYFTAVTDLLELRQQHVAVMKTRVDDLVREYRKLKLVTVPQSLLEPATPTSPLKEPPTGCKPSNTLKTE